MLILSRGEGESVVIGDNIEVTVARIFGNKVRLGFTAPKEVTIHRKEVFEAIKKAEGSQTLAISEEDVINFVTIKPVQVQPPEPSMEEKRLNEQRFLETD